MKQEMAEKAKPPMKAIIREDECIGCTKCLQACPVDAILGGPKRMHTVIEQECTGCELCVEPCPVDCIDMVEIAEMTAKDRQWQADNARQRYQARQKRLDKRHKRQQKQHQQAKLGENKRNKTLSARKEAIQAAVARAKAKKRNN
jgi:electron transport complex protein RnfB